MLPNWGHRSSRMLRGKLCSWPPTFLGNPSGPVFKRQEFINNHELLGLCRWTGVVLKHRRPITNLRRVTSQKNKSRNYTTAETAAKLPGCLSTNTPPSFWHKINRTGNVQVKQQWGTFVQPLLQWKSNKYYIL